MNNIFGQPIKPDRPAPASFETPQASQEALFSKSGLPGQKNLFADVGVPDELLNDPQEDEDEAREILRGQAADDRERG